MSQTPLFQLNPDLDRKALAARFARDGRVQIRDLLTEETANTVHQILTQTPWGLAVNPQGQTRSIRAQELARMPQAERHALGATIAQTVRQGGYGFAYGQYPMVNAYLERWAPGSPHDLLLEHINDAPLMELVRAVAGDASLVKADAQATLFGPNQFLGLHIDSHVAEGWKLAYVMSFARDWRPDWGGYLLFYDEEGDVVAGFRPRFNAMNIFAVPQPHAVTYVPPFAPAGRFAITGWFRDR